MLKIYFGELEEAIFNTPQYFDINWEDEWLEDEFTKEMVRKIDKSEVLEGGVIKSPVFGLMPPERLSGGVKTLILMNNEPDKIFNASQCGNNCVEFIMRIAEEKDITIRLGHFMEFKEPFDIEIANNGNHVKTMMEIITNAVPYIYEISDTSK